MPARQKPPLFNATAKQRVDMSNGKPSEQFNVRLIIEKIDRCIALGDEQGAIMEINRPWPGMDGDIGLVVHELMSELLQNGRVPLFVKDMQFDDEAQTVDVQFPDWFQAANRVFEQRYPNPDEARLRFQKAMSAVHLRLMAVQGQPHMGLDDLTGALEKWLPADWSAQHRRRLH
jgi:hypothetical protein